MALTYFCLQVRQQPQAKTASRFLILALDLTVDFSCRNRLLDSIEMAFLELGSLNGSISIARACSKIWISSLNINEIGKPKASSKSVFESAFLVAVIYSICVINIQ